MVDQQKKIDTFRRQVLILRILQMLNCMAAVALMLLCFSVLPERGIRMPSTSASTFIWVLCLVALPATLLLVELRVRAVKKALSESNSGDSKSNSGDS
jgi:hypothetical protein